MVGRSLLVATTGNVIGQLTTNQPTIMCSRILLVTNVTVSPDHRQGLMDEAKEEAKVTLTIVNELGGPYEETAFVILCYQIPFTTAISREYTTPDVIVARVARVRKDDGTIHPDRQLRYAGAGLGRSVHGLTITNDEKWLGNDAWTGFVFRVKPVYSLESAVDLKCRVAIVLGRNDASLNEMLTCVIGLIHFCDRDF